MLIHQKKGEKKLHMPIMAVMALLFIGVFAYFVFAVQEIDNVTLSSSSGDNQSGDNLTATVSPLNASQGYIYDWRKDGNSIAVLNMPFDDDSDCESGTKVCDYSDNGNNGTIIGATWNATGGHESNGAYEFDSINDYIRIENSANGSLDFVTGEEFSVSLWLYVDSSETGNGYIFAKREGTGENAQYGVYYSGGNKAITFALGASTLITSNDAITLGDWHHIVVMYSPNNLEKIYINGVLKKSGTMSSIPHKDYDVLIGARWQSYPSSIGLPMDGAIDDLIFFDSYLSEEQVSALYNNRTDLIVSHETEVGETWSVMATPAYEGEVGNSVLSNNVIIQVAVPTIDSVILNSTFGINSTAEDLTAYAVNKFPTDANVVYDWKKEGSSIAVLNMPFDDNLGCESGTKACDYSDNGNNGTIGTSLTWTSSGYMGGAYEFNLSAGNYIIVPGVNDYFTDGQSLTFTAWVKFNDGGDGDRIFDKSGNGNASIQLRYQDSKLKVFIQSSNDPSSFNFISSTTLSVDTWYHTALVIDQENGEATIYLNGISDSASYSFLSGHFQNEVDLTIGTRALALEQGNAKFNGNIDEFMIYKRALTPEQISALYNNRTDLIVDHETEVGETWSVMATPTYEGEVGTGVLSNNVIIQVAVPTIDSVILNSTFGINSTAEDLTAYAVNKFPTDANVVYDWKKEGSSIAVLNMPFDDNLGCESGTKACDYSDNGNNGTIIGATWNTTRGHDSNGAYEFDGINDYIRIENSATGDLDFVTGEEFSVSLWLYVDSSETGNGYIFAKREGTGENAQYGVYYSGGNKAITFALGASTLITSNDAITLGDWHHIVVMYSPNNLEKIYINGVLKKSGTMSSIPHKDYDVLIGARWQSYPSSIGLPMDGAIDDLIFFDSYLSEEQVSALYNNRTDLIVSHETEVGETWSVMATPAYEGEVGNSVLSNNLAVLEAPTINAAVNKTSTSPDFIHDFPFEFVINITNNGEENLTSILAYDNFNDSVMAFSISSCNDSITNIGSDNGGAWLDINVTDCIGGDLGIDESFAIYLNFTDGGANLPVETINSIEIEVYDYLGQNVNSSDNASITIRGPNITVVKSLLNSGNISVGDTVQFLLNATNLDNSLVNFTNLSLFDEYDSSFLNYISSDAAPYSSSTGEVEWKFNLTDSFVVYANFTALASGNTTNNASITEYEEEGETIHSSSNVSLTILALLVPTHTEFDNYAAYGSTNFSAVADLNNVANMVLANAYGGVAHNQNVSAQGEDYDTNVEIGEIYISVNSTALHSTFNASSNITLENSACNSGTNEVYYSAGFYTSRTDVMSNGQVCNATTSPACTNIVCNSTSRELAFTAPYFSSYASNAYSNLSIWDENDAGMPYGGQSKKLNEEIKFFANYTMSNGSVITSATCQILFNDTSWNNMAWNGTANLYDYNRTFTTAGFTNWNVSCNKTGYGTLDTNDTILFVSVDAVILNSTSGNNLTGEDLTAYPINATPANAEIDYDWYRNGTLFTNQINNSEATFAASFDSGDGTYNSTYAEDLSGNGKHATVSGAAFSSTGGYDSTGAYHFAENTYNKIIIPDKNIVTETAGSIAMWFNLDNLDGGSVAGDEDHTILFHGGEDDGVGSNPEFYGFVDPTGSLRIYQFVSSGSTYVSSDAGSISAGEWNHLAIIWNNKNYTLYLNGNLVDSSIEANDVMISNWTDDGWHIGHHNQGSNADRGTDGYIDEVYFFDRSITSAEVDQLYGNSPTLDSSFTSVGDVWYVNVTPSYNGEAGNSVLSNNLTINPLSIDAVILNSTLGTNLTSENLTAYPINLLPADAKVIYDWKKNSNSIAAFNMPFEYGSNSSFAKDYSDYGNDGTVINATYSSTAGFDGKGAYYFDGADDYISINTAIAEIASADSFTFTSWVNPDGAVSANDQFIFAVNHNSATNNYFGIGREDGAGLEERFMIYSDDSFNHPGSFVFSPGTWTFVAVIVDTANDKIISYVNANNTGNISFAGTIPSNARISIGQEFDDAGPAKEWKGYIDEVMLYNHSLSAEQISLLYNNRTDMVSSDETAGGEVWSASAVPVISSAEGNATISNNLTVIGINPSVFDLRPLSNASYNVSDVIEIAANVTSYDPVDKVFVNITLPNGTITRLNLSNVNSTYKYNNSFAIPNMTGQYNLTFIANDTIGNLNASETTFFAGEDVIAPVIALISPENGTALDEGDIAFTANATDNVGVANATLYVYNGTTLYNQTILVLNGSAAESLSASVSLVEGNYTWYYGAFDTTGNYNASLNRTLFISSVVIPNQPALVYPANSLENIRWPARLNVTVTENQNDTMNVSFWSRVVSIDSGSGASCGILDNGNVMCWGNNNNGQLGDGKTCGNTCSSPVNISVSGITDRDFVAISVGYRHSCGVLDDGRAMCWGNALYGRLGNSQAADTDFTSPVFVSSADNFVSVSSGKDHTCGIIDNGNALCWGSAADGKLGNGASSGSYSTPAALNLNESFALISAGESHTCGIINDGTMYCWGSAADGKLGNGVSSGSYSTPAAVSSSEKFISVSAGSSHTCGVTSAGNALCWGSAVDGKLGNGITSGNYSSPAIVNTTEKFISISAGSTHTCGLLEDNSIMCWGANNYGQLGIGTDSAAEANPSAVSGNYSIVSLGSFDIPEFSCSVLSNGTAVCYGRNTGGEIGTGASGPDDCSGNSCAKSPAAVDTLDIFENKVGLLGKDYNIASGDNSVFSWADGSYARHYLWGVSITDKDGVRLSPAWAFRSRGTIYSNVSYFDFGTTDWDAIDDLRNVTNATIGRQNSGTVRWNGTVNAENINLDSSMFLQNNNITVIPGSLHSSFNASSELNMLNLTWNITPVILSDGEVCSDCADVVYNSTSGSLVFTASHFSSYTTQGNASLLIWDSNDADMPYGDRALINNEDIKFFANYTSGSVLTGANCSIWFNDTSSWTNMSYNSSSELYEYNRSFASIGDYSWNVTCLKNSYVTLTLNDTIELSERTLSGLVISKSGSNIVINWTAVPGVDGYKIWYNGDALNIINLNSSIAADVTIAGSSVTWWIDTAPGSYRYYAVGYYKGSAVNVSSVKLGKFDISITAGVPNLISLPLVPQDNSISAIIPSGPSDSDRIMTYVDGVVHESMWSGSAWAATAGSGVSTLSAGQGYYLYPVSSQYTITSVGIVHNGDSRNISVNAGRKSFIGTGSPLNYNASVIQPAQSGNIMSSSYSPDRITSFTNGAVAQSAWYNSTNGWYSSSGSGVGVLEPGRGYLLDPAASSYDISINFSAGSS